MARHRHRAAAPLRPDPEPRQHGEGLRGARAGDVRRGDRAARRRDGRAARARRAGAARAGAGAGRDAAHGRRRAVSRPQGQRAVPRACSASLPTPRTASRSRAASTTPTSAAYDTLVQTFPSLLVARAVRVRHPALLRGRPGHPGLGPAPRGLVRYDVDKYNTSRALPRPRRRTAGPHRRPRRRRGRRAGGRAGAGPGVRHEPGHRPPRPRPAAPGRASSPAAGARAGSPPSTPSASRSGGSPPSRPRSRRPAPARAARSSPSDSSSAPAAVADALQIERGAEVLRVERVNLADDEPFALVTVWVRGDVGADVSRADVERAPFYDLLPLRGRRARIGAPDDHRRDRERVRRRACSRARPARRCCCAAASRSTRPGAPTLVSEHRYPADRTTFEIEFSLRAGALQHA